MSDTAKFQKLLHLTDQMQSSDDFDRDLLARLIRELVGEVLAVEAFEAKFLPVCRPALVGLEEDDY